MASATVNVARWSALAFGVVYGISHHQTLKKAEEKRHVEHRYKQKEETLKKAKAAWTAKQKETSPLGSNAVISNPDDPNFDLEVFIKSVEDKQRLG